MAAAKITGPGLAAITVCVMALWGCLIGERVILRRAHSEQMRAVHDLEQLRRQDRARPVSEPATQPWRRPNRTAQG